MPNSAPPALLDYLSHPHAELRARVLEHLATDAFDFDSELDRATHRRRTLEALQCLADDGLGLVGFPEAYGGGGDPRGAIAVFETLAFGDISTVIKFGVQFGLWGGSLYQLGTERHHERWLEAMARLELPGCFAMTEIGHGSNVRGIETTATYDADTDELVVHTPHEGAGKEWIGNAALHGRMASVFVKLHLDGENHGVHAVVVPLRDAEGNPLPGIRIEDNGPKVGLNGVDNGRIWFDSVRVPRDHLLDRFGRITDEGKYESPIESEGRRFFTMLGTLVAGRVSVGAAAVSAAKTALTIGVRYSDRRRQFGPSDGPEVPILDYTTQQRALLPRLATTYALHFALRSLANDCGLLLGAGQLEEEGQEVEARAAGLKAYATWHALDTVQVVREGMGGRGFHADNRIGQIRRDIDIFATFEGTNIVLLQLLAKSLLTQYRKELGTLGFWDVVRIATDRAQERVTELNPIITRRTDPDHLRDPDLHRHAFEYRERRLLATAGRRLKRLFDDGVDAFEALNVVQDHLIALANAHVERHLCEAFLEGVARAPDVETSETLRTLAQLFALERLEADRAWFLEAGYFEPAKSKAIRTEVNALCREVREIAVPLVDAFGIPDAVLRARDA
ncbi:MAG: acyl-CoA dehydrogenase [Longimicrobiales bacterium]|nr:acyl-CoA dehydrogenase [Longimicrobiales bacterium]